MRILITNGRVIDPVASSFQFSSLSVLVSAQFSTLTGAPRRED